MLGSAAFGVIAGVLSTLSPCVLPLLPLVLAAAATTHRLGPVVLACGLALSFVSIGIFVALIGFSIGLDLAIFRMVAGVLLIVFGAVLTAPSLQLRLAMASSPLVDWADRRLGGFDTGGLTGQFGLGLLLGAIWTPCVGPTLGAASLMAARGENLAQIVVTMMAFGIGAALPLLILGFLSRETLKRWRERMLGAGRNGKTVLGWLLILFGGLVISGLDKRLEASLVEFSPAWLTELTTRF